jgi:hypothetical protein
MDNGIAVNTLAVAVSVISLALSTRLTINQSKSQRFANYLPVITALYDAFRSRDFHRKYAYICRELGQFDPTLGISELPAEAQDAIYDLAYLFQSFALLGRIGVIDDDKFLALLRQRVIDIWSAIAPFVRAERTKVGGSVTMLRYLEDFAAQLAEV